MMTTTTPRIRLEILEVTTPCPADWNAMSVEDDRTRHCRHCAKNVFDLSAMNRQDAEAFVAARYDAGESVCIRLFKRADGTVVTADCRGQWRQSTRRWAAKWAGTASAVMSLLLFSLGYTPTNPPPVQPVQNPNPSPKRPPTALVGMLPMPIPPTSQPAPATQPS